MYPSLRFMLNFLISRTFLASSPGRQLKFGKKDGLVSIATLLVRMRWPLPEKVVIVYCSNFACNPVRKLFFSNNGEYRGIP